jgi:Dip2/Utp12 family protein
MEFMVRWLKAGQRVEKVLRAVHALVTVHHTQLTASATAVETLSALSDAAKAAALAHKDVIGQNLAALTFLRAGMGGETAVLAPPPPPNKRRKRRPPKLA